jgi:cyanate permease
MVVSYISIGLLAQYIGLWVVIGRKNYVQAPIDSSQPLYLSSENNTVNFLICATTQVICGFLICSGHPLKQPFYRNYLYTLFMGLAFIFDIAMIIDQQIGLSSLKLVPL